MSFSSTSIALSKRKLVLLAVGCLGFVALGTWLAAAPLTFRENPFVGDPALIRFFGLLGAVFFGVIGILIGRKLRDQAPGLVVDAAGFTDNSSGLAAGPVPWTEVAGLDEFHLLGQRFVVVRLLDPAAFIARQSNTLKRQLLQTNLKSYGSPIFLSANTLQCTHDELRALLAAGLAAASARR